MVKTILLTDLYDMATVKSSKLYTIADLLLELGMLSSIDQIESEIADIKNTGGRAGGAETAGAFLKRVKFIFWEFWEK